MSEKAKEAVSKEETAQTETATVQETVQNAVVDLDNLVKQYDDNITNLGTQQAQLVANTNQLLGAKQLLLQFKANNFIVLNANLLPKTEVKNELGTVN